MYLYEFDNCAAVCAHHVIFAAFHRHKRHSSIVVLVQGIQASADAKCFVYLEVYLHTVPLQMTNLQQVIQNLANCQQRIVSFSRTIYIFLKEKYYQQYIWSLFKVVLMEFEQYYFLP